MSEAATTRQIPGARIPTPAFALLTATVSWFLQLFPALTRRRTLAHQLNLVREAGGQAGIAGLDPTHSAALIEPLAASVATVSVGQCLTVTHCTTGTVRNVLGPGTNHPENAFPALSRTCSVDDGGTALSWCRGSG